jgi:hypothetical protein
MSPIFGIGLFAYCIRDSKKEEMGRRKKSDSAGEALPGGPEAPPVFLPGAGAGMGGGGGGGMGMGAALY